MANNALGTNDVLSSTPKRRAWWTQLWAQVLISMAMGVGLGHFFPDLGVRMQVVGDAFIKAIRMIIAPVIFCTVVHGIGRMTDMTRVGRVAIKAIVYFEVVTTLALVIGLILANVFKPGVGMNVDLSQIDTSTVKSYIVQSQRTDIGTVLVGIIPATFVGAFSEGSTLQVLFIAVLSGFALSKLGPRAQPIVDLVDRCAHMFFAIVNMIMWAAPLGAFGAIAFTVARFGISSLGSLAWLIGCFYATCIIFVVGVLWPISAWAGFSLPKLLRYLWEDLLIVLATTSSETVLPRLIRKMELAGCEESVVGLVVPTSYSFNLDGTCLYLAMVSVFLAQATNTPFDVSQQIGLLLVLLIASKGVAGVAGSAFVVLAATLSTGSPIPVASVALVLGIHRLMAEGLTTTSYVGTAVATLFIAKWDNALDERKLSAALDGSSTAAQQQDLTAKNS
jgi:aerobic C4-dicarboxylate transport protein